jgi:fatty-acyl-CoA synthase
MYLARRISKQPAYDLRSLRALVSCSEPCKPEAFDVFQERFAGWGLRREVLQTCYAMAETVFAVSQSDVTRPVRRLTINRNSVARLGRVGLSETADDRLTLLSNGRPIDGCAVRVRRDGKFLSEMEIGEICVSAEFMFSGYYKNPEARSDAFVDAWYCTGDLGFIQQGEIFIVGRLKDVIIINGKNVFAHDIEAAMGSISGIKPGRCVAVGHYAEKVGSEQLVIIAERDGDGLDDGLLQREINRAVVEEIGIPCNDIRLVDPGWLVKTTSGKLSRTENAKKYAAVFVT